MTPNAAKQLLTLAQHSVATAAGDAKRGVYDSVLLSETRALLTAYRVATRGRKHGALPPEYHAAYAELEWLERGAREAVERRDAYAAACAAQVAREDAEECPRAVKKSTSVGALRR